MYWLLFIHWLADFVFQTNWMAKNKSRNIWALLLHIVEYTTVLVLCGGLFVLSPKMLVLNCASHLAIDFVTSKWTSWCWRTGQIHEFFVVVGFDQFMHVALLYYSI